MGKVIFVFGGNFNGMHFHGAAAYAVKYYGAEQGRRSGRTGDAYAIPVISGGLAVSLHVIQDCVMDFKAYARAHPELTFNVTRICDGIRAYDDETIAMLFRYSPKNCRFPPMWEPYMKRNKRAKTKFTNSARRCNDGSKKGNNIGPAS